jgi:hypothetical protein
MAGSTSGPAPGLPGIEQTNREQVEQALARIGQSVAGRWTLTRLLGIGGMASVYEAKHRNGRKAAVKVLHPHIQSRPAARHRFLSEGYAANKVDHPGVVLILDDGEDGDLIFLVRELLSGRSLAERLSAEGPLPVADVVKVASALLDVLAAAHDRGVVHRDIKPSNVFELENGEIKVLDFGVAQVRDPETAAVTESGVAVGTPAFMAPEQAAGRTEEVDALTDIWAVGATMFQLLTGRLVHETERPNAAIVAAATKPAPAVRSLRPAVPDELAAIVDRALAFHREDRWPNARSMRRALGATSSDVLLASAATVPEARIARPVRRAKRAFAAGAIALGVAGAIAAAWLTSVKRASDAAPPVTAAAPPQHPTTKPSLEAPEPVPPTIVRAATASAGSPPASATAPPSAPAAGTIPTARPATRAAPIQAPQRRPPALRDEDLIETRQ